MLLSIHGFLGNAGVAWMDSYLPLSILAVMTAIIIHTILLMAGRAFHIRELESYATSEIMQAAATAFMAIFLIVILESALTIGANLIYGELSCGGKTISLGTGAQEIGTGKKTVMDNAYEVIKCRLQERAITVATAQEQIMDRAIGEFMLLNMQASTFGITFFKGDWISSVYESTEKDRITNNLATVMLIGLNAQYSLADYLRINMLHVFIPLGILLRSFYFTRGPGALLIALGVGMYFIFPVFYVLLDPGFVKLPMPTTPPRAPATHYCYATMSSAVSLVNTMQAQGTGSTSALEYGDFRNALAKAYIALMLHPLVTLSITLVFVRYMMTVLGGDTYELTRMVTKVI